MTIETYIGVVILTLVAVFAVIAAAGWSKETERLATERTKNAFLKEINAQQREEIARLTSEKSIWDVNHYERNETK